MRSNRSLTPPYFLLTLFSDYGPLKYLFFTLSLLTYMTIILANLVIIATICLEKSLHQPMYVFICCLSLNSLYGSAGFFPRFLTDLLSDTHLISRLSCFAQIYVVYTYASYELTILSAMAYDRFVAICRPLRYRSKMSFRFVLQVLIFAWLCPMLAIGICVYLSVRLPLCGNELHGLLCTNWPVVQLSCVDTAINGAMGRLVTVVTIFIPLAFVLYTYMRILHVCHRSASDVRGKAVQTCLPHIATFLNYVFTIFCELLLTRYGRDEINPYVKVFLSLEFLIIPPINNPLVYGLSLPQIRKGIFRFYTKCLLPFRILTSLT